MIGRSLSSDRPPTGIPQPEIGDVSALWMLVSLKFS